MRFILAAALAAAPLCAVAQDDERNAAAVKARQGYFTMLGANMAPLAAMAKGEMEYDEAAAVRAASNIEALATYDVSIHFPAGTSRADLGDVTEAKAEIWSNLDDFVSKRDGFRTAAAGAADAVKGGRANVGARLAQLGASCKACHDSYRSK